MLYLCQRYPDIIQRNKEAVERIINEKELAWTGKAILTNLDESILQLGVQLLHCYFGIDVWVSVVELPTDFDESTLHQKEASEFLNSMLEAGGEPITTPLNAVLLQSAVKRKKSSNTIVRNHSVQVLIGLGKAENNRQVVSNALVKGFDEDDVRTKIYMLRNLDKISEIDQSTAAYIKQKASLDSHYYVRKICEEEVLRDMSA